MLKDSNIQFVTNQQGEKVSVLLPIKEWDDLMKKMEMLEDVKAFDEAMNLNEEAIPLEEAFQIIESERAKLGK